MKIFCTGNPKRKTIAYALNADLSASLSSGWDFTNNDTIEKFKQTIVEYNVFVNSAFVLPGVQQTLMNLCYQEWMRTNVRGHIVNIGTTLENTDDQGDYSTSKRSLKAQSMLLSDQTGISGVKTSYIVLGGLGEDACKPSDIAQAIRWIVSQPYRIPVIQIESVK